MLESEICFITSTELAARIRAGDLSASEVMEAHLDQIEHTNPRVNAIVTLMPEKAIEEARAADERLARVLPAGPLHGLPVAHKDLVPTGGIRTTFGSCVFEDHVPEEDALIVERLKGAGAITLGKTNTPEFGAGSQTYNEVFGETLNPDDPTRTCGGSSGGAAATLACGMLPIADGSDMGGSLRNPASFCNVVGFPSLPGQGTDVVGRRGVVHALRRGPHGAHGTGRCPHALRHLRPGSALAHLTPRARQRLLPAPGARFGGVRVAWSRDLGGLPMDGAVTDILDGQRHVFEDLGCVVEDAEPDFRDADEVFKVLRAWRFELAYGRLLDAHRDEMKDTVVWNIKEGKKLDGPRIGWAERKRTELYHRVRTFMQNYDFLVLPVSQVPPFDVKQRYVTEINGETMETYIDWMKSCYYVTVTGLPAASVPCGFTPEGLPVGVQIVGRPGDDFGVLQLAHAFEEAPGFWRHRPPMARDARL